MALAIVNQMIFKNNIRFKDEAIKIMDESFFELIGRVEDKDEDLKRSVEWFDENGLRVAKWDNVTKEIVISKNLLK